MHKLEEPQTCQATGKTWKMKESRTPLASRAAQIHESKRAYRHSPRGNERVGCRIPLAQPQGRSKPRIDERAGADTEAKTLPGLCQSGLHGRMSRRYRHPVSSRTLSAVKFLEAAKNIERNQCIACRLRSRLSAGKAMRIQMYPSER